MSNIFGWFVIGIISGILVHFVFPHKNEYLTGTISAGIVGAFAGGMVYSALRLGYLAANININSLVIAFSGSLILIIVIKKIIKSDNLKEKEY